MRAEYYTVRLTYLPWRLIIWQALPFSCLTWIVSVCVCVHAMNSGASEMSALLLLQSSLVAWGCRTHKHSVWLGQSSLLAALLSFPIIRLSRSLSPTIFPLFLKGFRCRLVHMVHWILGSSSSGKNFRLRIRVWAFLATTSAIRLVQLWKMVHENTDVCVTLVGCQ